jgi:hypothetical protein
MSKNKNKYKFVDDLDWTSRESGMVWLKIG